MSKMRAGYPWTNQIPAMLQLLLQTTQASTTVGTTADKDHMMEVLGGHDMNAWIIGRQTKPLHIWAEHCMGQSGVEAVTGLPRRLLDLIAQASMGRNVRHKVETWAAEAPLEPQPDSIKVWHCYRLATLLYMNNTSSERDTSPDVELIAGELWGTVHQILYHQSVNNDFNQRVLIWPLYTLALSTHNRKHSAKALTLIVNILRDVTQGGFDEDPLLRIIQTCLDRRSRGAVAADGDVVARELGLEVGLW